MLCRENGFSLDSDELGMLKGNKLNLNKPTVSQQLKSSVKVIPSLHIRMNIRGTISFYGLILLADYV